MTNERREEGNKGRQTKEMARGREQARGSKERNNERKEGRRERRKID
jgi:hypothetical protein